MGKLMTLFVVCMFSAQSLCVENLLAAEIEKKVQENLGAKLDKELIMLRKLGQLYQLQEGLLREIKMGLIFTQSLEGIDWLESKNFSPSGWAANFSLLYVLLRVLNDFRPKEVLELGTGQTTRLTYQYATHNGQAAVTVVDHSKYWIDFTSQKIKVPENMKFLELPLCPGIFNGNRTTVYKDLAKNVGATKFDLILVDGGDGEYRTSFFDLIPRNLKKSFVIILDDFHYPEKKETVKALEALLTELKIKYDSLIVKGQKQQFVVFSPDIVFLKHL
jgi:hypothetical protein